MEKGTSAPQRFRAKRKAEAVLRLLRGEDLELLSRELGVAAATLSEWNDAFLAGGEAGLTPRPVSDVVEARRFTAKIGELSMENELLRKKIARMEAGRPLARRKSRK